MEAVEFDMVVWVWVFEVTKVETAPVYSVLESVAVAVKGWMRY